MRMRLIIIGTNHAEMVKFTAKQENWPFASIRRGAYQTYPESFARLEIIEDGELVETDEVLIFPENRLTPYNPIPSKEFFSTECIVMRAEEVKNDLGMMEKPYVTFSDAARWIWRWWPMLLAGGLLIYAFISSI